MMDKRQLVAAVIAQLEARAADLKKAAQAAYEGATHEDAVAKSKYDTHGLELSYLAGSQLERLAALESEIQLLGQRSLPTFGADDPVAVGSVVELAQEGRESTWLFISDLGAGTEAAGVKVVSPQSQLAQGLMDHFVGEEPEVRGKGTLIIKTHF